MTNRRAAALDARILASRPEAGDHLRFMRSPLDNSAQSRASHVTSVLLPAALIAHCLASLVHFTHNAVYLADYPNMPAWFTPGGVYGAWCALTALGLAGFGLVRAGLTRVGLLIIAVYALLGFGGLDHYTIASIASHSLAMNLTIALETGTAAVLLITLLRELAVRFHSPRL
jgi:hypothetical protein